ncbi:hypothetical protein DPMN_001154 [Dreissena polymorpha]|uniref:Uncharacterized protein n=1 Tax=Dreissena polymorpha TaxID=45954 RepID=A0A9D4RQ50_DREPO|nr:hypothetical protein DPMN_001154 [Dreissena polymorpha]
MASIVLRSTLFEGNARLLSSSAALHRSSWEYLPYTQANPPGQDTKSQTYARANTHRHRLTLIFLEILSSGHLSSWQYLHQGTRLFTSMDRVARAYGHPSRHPRPSDWLHIMQHGPVT